MSDIWNSARFIPHWSAFLITLVASLFVGGVMILGWSQNTVAVSNVTCSVKSSYPGSRDIDLVLDCGGHETTISSPVKMVFDVVSKHVKTVKCDALYEDGSVEGCKYDADNL